MSTYRYTRLHTGDAAHLRSLLRVFADAFEDHENYQSAVPGDAYLERLLAKPDFIAVIAARGNEIAGGLAAYLLEKFEQDRREIYIYDIAVAVEHRRRGVATGLIQELTAIAKRLNAYGIFVQADSGDEPAIQLYESLGTRQDVHHFDIDLD